MDPLKDFHKTVLSLDNCIIPNERLIHTPSSRDGVSHDLEVDLRIVGCEYIQSAGLLLRLPQVAMATAQVIFQRFYYSKSFVKYSIYPMAMACIFLAAKIEEDCRRLRDVINVFHHLRQKRMGSHSGHQREWLGGGPFLSLSSSGFWRKRKGVLFPVKGGESVLPDLLGVPVVPMEYMGEDYFKTKATVIKYERFILKELGFCVHVKHPHKMIVTYLQILDLDMEQNTAAALRQRAWNYMNDSLRTNLFVRFPPETIACACIFLASRELKIPLCQSPPWWLVFDANYENIEVICKEVLALFRRPKRFLEDLEKQVAVLREKLALKKQVEIKEVDVKKAGSVVSSNAASPNNVPSPAARLGDQRDKSKSKSPAPVLVRSRSSKPGGSALLPTPPTSQMLSRDGVQKSQVVLPDRNGEEQLIPLKKKQTNSRSRSPPSIPHSRTQSPTPPRRKLSSSSHSDQSRSRSRSRSPSHSGSQDTYKPIHSPIKLSSGESHSDSYSPLANENGVPDDDGIPEQYKRDYENDRRVRKGRHKHRTDKREKHHRRKAERGNSRERGEHRRHRHREERDRDPFRERDRERDSIRERDRERDIFRERERERDIYRHDREREYPKMRKSNSYRYR